jgi:hypothetical protein
MKIDFFIDHLYLIINKHKYKSIIINNNIILQKIISSKKIDNKKMST